MVGGGGAGGQLPPLMFFRVWFKICSNLQINNWGLGEENCQISRAGKNNFLQSLTHSGTQAGVCKHIVFQLTMVLNSRNKLSVNHMLLHLIVGHGCLKVSFKFSKANLHSNEFRAAVEHFLRAVLACSPIFNSTLHFKVSKQCCISCAQRI